MTKNEKREMYYDYFKLEVSQLLSMHHEKTQIIMEYGIEKFYKLYNYNKELAFTDYKTYKSYIKI